MCSRPSKVEARGASVAFTVSFVLHAVKRLCAHLWYPVQVSRTIERCGLVVCSMIGDERSWIAALSCHFRFLDRQPGIKRASRRSLEADPQPCGL